MKKLMVIAALLMLWSYVASAQSTFGWEVNVIAIREGRTEEEMKKMKFPRGERPPKGADYVMMNLPSSNGLAGWITLGKVIFNFYEYNVEKSDDGHIGMFFKDTYDVVEELEDGGIRYMVNGHYNEENEPDTDFRAITDNYVSVGVVNNIGF
jgi:hypothetical protein